MLMFLANNPRLEKFLVGVIMAVFFFGVGVYVGRNEFPVKTTTHVVEKPVINNIDNTTTVSGSLGVISKPTIPDPATGKPIPDPKAPDVAVGLTTGTITASFNGGPNQPINYTTAFDSFLKDNQLKFTMKVDSNIQITGPVPSKLDVILLKGVHGGNSFGGGFIYRPVQKLPFTIVLEQIGKMTLIGTTFPVGFLNYAPEVKNTPKK